MYEYTLEDVKQLLKDHHDPDELIQLFDATSDQLVEFYSGVVEDNYERFLDVVTASDIVSYYLDEEG